MSWALHTHRRPSIICASSPQNLCQVLSLHTDKECQYAGKRPLAGRWGEGRRRLH